MSIATEVMRVKYQGDGSTTSFTFPFKINAADDIKVLLYDSTEKTITEVTDFTLSPNSSYPSLGGTITYPATGTAADSTKTVIIERSMDILQDDTYQYGDTLNLDNLERSFDTMVMQQQQNADKSDRSIKIDESEDMTDIDTRVPAPSPNEAFCWDDTGKKLTTYNVQEVIDDTSNAASSAASASAAASAAALSQQAAAVSESNAAASQQAAANSEIEAAQSAAEAEVSSQAVSPSAYSSTTTYNFPDVVAYTDGNTYRCIGTNVTGEIPGISTNWVKMVTIYGDFFDVDTNGDYMPSVSPTYSNNLELDTNGDLMPQ